MQKMPLMKSTCKDIDFHKALAFGGLALLIIVFSFASPNFLQWSNMVSILIAASIVGVLGIGVNFVIITGGIDLSVGTVMTFSSMMTGICVSKWGLPIPLGVLGGIATGALCGWVNGVAVSKMKLPPFIATLSMMMIAKGFSLIVSGAMPIYFDPAYAKISMGSIVPKLGIPNIVLIFFIMVIIAETILKRTILGRYNYAIGSNEEAVRLSGVNVDRWKTVIYMICGICSGLAGILMSSRISSAQPCLGEGYELEAIAAVVLGGTSLNGGTGSATGVVIGALVMSVLTNGLRLLSVPQEWQKVVTGLIIYFVVYSDLVRRKRSN
jgi:ribose transport system permease protein